MALGKIAPESPGKIYSLSDIRGAVYGALSGIVGNDCSGVPDDMSFRNQLGLDSLDCVEYVTALEESLGFLFPDEDLEKLQTPGQTIDYLRAHLQKSGRFASSDRLHSPEPMRMVA